jgi:ketosteroid isomerase-like protein
MAYNYYSDMKDAIKNYIDDDFDFSSVTDLDEMSEKLSDDLWTVDSVTGNSSGSYTFNRWEAQQYVMNNIDLVQEAFTEFDQKEKFADWFFDNNFEAIDVTVRCYLLSEVVSEVLTDNKDEYEMKIEEANSVEED